MEARRRQPHEPPQLKLPRQNTISGEVSPRASDALPLPLYLTNGVFLTLFFSVVYFLLQRWREKIRDSIPLHVVTLSEIAAIVTFLASFIYLLGFFGIGFVQSFISPRSSFGEEDEEVILRQEKQILRDDKRIPCGIPIPLPEKVLEVQNFPKNLDLTPEDEEIVESVVKGTTPSYSLESKLGDCFRAAKIRREALQRITGRSLMGLPLDGFDYESILGQCCEMPVGVVQIPVGIAGPLLLDGREYSVPMATTEGCLVASTNRGCKAIHLSGGASSVILKDGMTRAPVVRFGSVRRAAELKFFLEDPANFETVSLVFNKYVFFFVFICTWYEND